MTKEWIKQFVDLVKSDAQFKAYQKYLGLDRAGVKAHLAMLPQYEKMLAEPTEVAKPKESKKLSSKDFAEALGATVVSETPKLKLSPAWKKAVEEVVVTEEELIEKLSDKEKDEDSSDDKEDEDL